MPRHLQREIENLKKKILALGAVVEERVHSAVKSLAERDERLAAKVIKNDFEIDNMEVDVEEDCLKILALHQPVAIDLRFIIAVLKINNDLERIADLAVDIAERAAFLANQEPVNLPFNIQDMARKVQIMLQQSLDSLVNLDATLAWQVTEADDEVDAMNREMYARTAEAIRKQPERIESLMHMLSASRHLERIADHATNVAEDVVYMVEGEIVRHKTEDFSAQHENA